MKVNFREFPVYTSVRREKKENVDISEGFANLIYTSIGGIGASSLAHRIYEEGILDLSEREIGIILQASRGCVGMIADSIVDFLKENGYGCKD